MTNLKLNQKILVQSSCYFGGQLIELDKTSVYDVIDGRVKMENNNNWGACPTRDRKDVISTEEEAEAFFKKKVEMHKDSLNKNKDDVFLVKDDKGRNSVSIFRYRKQEPITSLREGTGDVYVATGGSNACYYTDVEIRIPQGSNYSPFCDTLEEALEEFKTKVVNNL
jgi:hypothetical protein